MSAFPSWLVEGPVMTLWQRRPIGRYAASLGRDNQRPGAMARYPRPGLFGGEKSRPRLRGCPVPLEQPFLYAQRRPLRFGRQPLVQLGGHPVHCSAYPFVLRPPVQARQSFLNGRNLPAPRPGAAVSGFALVCFILTGRVVGEELQGQKVGNLDSIRSPPPARGLLLLGWRDIIFAIL